MQSTVSPVNQFFIRFFQDSIIRFQISNHLKLLFNQKEHMPLDRFILKTRDDLAST